MDLLADENFPLDAVNLLSGAGHDIAAVVLDSPGVSDEEVIERAAHEGRVILTFDRDYGELLYGETSRTPSPAGVVYFRFDPSPPEEPARYPLDLLGQLEWTIAGKFTFVERDRVRQRSLPETR